MDLDSMQHIVEQAQILRKPIWEVVLDYDVENRMTTPEASLEHMRATWRAMVDAADAYSSDRRSLSGLVGGDGGRMRTYYRHHDSIGGEFTAEVMAQALAMGENNACMNRIVAAPTAGSCGILPGTVASLLAEGRCTREAAVMSLFTAGAFGMVIAQRATIAGAEGGCQAECGSASAMAAAALAELMGGSPGQCAEACAMAIKSQLGLVCDPVAGLVEIPCIKRNASGVMIAFAAAEMALAGIKSKIPADECIDAMRAVGESLPSSLRETARGGLAVTPTGELLRRQVFGEREK